MSIRQAYTDWATTYDADRNLTRDLDQVVTRETLAQLRYATVLELGCGTGKNTGLLAHTAQRVCATDFSEGMIRQAKAKIPGENVVFTIADLTQPWPYADQNANLIVCNLVLEHVADLDFIFAEAYRVAAPRGQFFVCELHPFRQYQGKKAVFERDHRQTEIPAFVHHISGFLAAAGHAGFRLESLREWWHEADQGMPPRLVSFLFEKYATSQ